MRALLVYPKFPMSFFSNEATMALIGRRTPMPPLGLITVAALLPQDWGFRLVDCNVRAVCDEDWEWAEIVMLSGMIVQHRQMMDLIREAKSRGRPVAVGGPYVTSVPEDAKAAGADFLVLDEGEITIPLFLEALGRGETSGTFRAGGEKPDVTLSPIPRYDLLDFQDYATMSVQFSRGCPFLCEFCDIIILYGRRPRTKTPKQVLAEMQALYDLGWRRPVFMVDDNFIGNLRTVKPLLRAMADWQMERLYPFAFNTEASVNLADDPDLMALMRLAHFTAVFVGIETPDIDSLLSTKKGQNVRRPLMERIKTIHRAGLRVNAGFIIGFDGEKPGADRRIVAFAEEAAIPQALVNLLQAVPQTHLTQRLRREGRLIETTGVKKMSDTCLSNFVPTRPVRELAAEHVNVTQQLYEPARFIRRVHRHCLELKLTQPGKGKVKRNIGRAELRGLAVVLWRNGVSRPTRWLFWSCLTDVLRKNRQAVFPYLQYFFQLEHFYRFRDVIRDDITAQLAALSEADRERYYRAPDEQPAKAAVNM